MQLWKWLFFFLCWSSSVNGSLSITDWRDFQSLSDSIIEKRPEQFKAVITKAPMGFQTLGTMAPLLGHVHVGLDIKFDEFHAICNKCKMLEELLPLDHVDLFRHSHLQARRELLCQVSFGQQKRGVLATLMISLAGVLGLGQILTWITGPTSTTGDNHQVIHQIAHEMDLLNHQMRNSSLRLDLWIKKMQAQTAKVMQSIVTEAYATELLALAQYQNEWSEAMNIMQTNRLPMSWMSKPWIKKLQAQLIRLQSKLLVRGTLPSLPHLWELSVSAVLTENHRLTLVIHAPITERSRLTIFKLTKDTLLLSPTQDRNLLQIHNNEFLAQNSKGHFVFTQKYLNDCLEYSKTYYCPAIVMQKQREDFCLTRLFDQNLDQIEKYCTTTISKRDMVWIREENYWIAYSRNLTPYSISCFGKETITGTFQNPTKIFIPNSCYLQGKDFKVYPVDMSSENGHFNVSVSGLNYEDISVPLLANLSKGTVNTMLLHSAQKLDLSFDKQLGHEDHLRKHDYWLVTGSIILLVTNVILITLVICIIKCMYRDHRRGVGT